MKTRLFFPMLLLVAAATACDRSAPSQPASAPAPANPGTTVAAVAPVAAAPAATPAKPVLASADGERPGSRLEIRELKRGADDTVMLKLEIYAGSEPFGFSSTYLGETGISGSPDYQSVGGIHLVDGVNKKKYFVVRDAESKCQCSNPVQDIDAGKSVNVWARFPAPPADVTASPPQRARGR